jgi:hypothetical protein
MAGLVPAIHAAPFPDNLRAVRRLDDVDDRDKLRIPRMLSTRSTGS